jgi:hypothetical protein
MPQRRQRSPTVPAAVHGSRILPEKAYRLDALPDANCASRATNQSLSQSIRKRRHVMQQLLLHLSEAPAQTLENFVPGSNAEVLAVLHAWLAGVVEERCVYLWGPIGCGKSHLLRAAAQGSQRAGRTLLVTYLGSVVRRMGNWMPISGTVDLMTQAGFDAPSVRSAVFRLKKRGWLVSETRAGIRGYALTDIALNALAAGDEVIWHIRQPANLEDGWCVLSASIPESARAKRHQLRSRLSALGFGNVSTAVWLAPARMLPSAVRAIDELDLTTFCAIFVGDHAGGQDLRDGGEDCRAAGKLPRLGEIVSKQRTRVVILVHPFDDDCGTMVGHI